MQTTTDWLLTWSSETCRSAADEQKCWEAVHCVENIQNFGDSDAACGYVLPFSCFVLYLSFIYLVSSSMYILGLPQPKT